jgi:hypothetical protein
MRYAIINYLNEKEHHMRFGPLFEELADETVASTFQSFFATLTHSVNRIAPIQGRET